MGVACLVVQESDDAPIPARSLLSSVLPEQTDRIRASPGALPSIVLPVRPVSMTICHNQLIHDVSAGKAAPRVDIVRRMSPAAILQTDREHEIVATSTVHRLTPQS